MGNLNLDVDNTKPVNFDYEPVPAGRYVCEIVAQETTSTKNNDGTVFKIQEKIIEGEFSGRILFFQMNLTNPSEKAQQIGRGQISALCQACNKVGMVEDGSELLGIKHVVSVSLEPAKGDYKAKNDFKGFYKLKAEKKAPAVAEPETNGAEDVSFDTDELPF